MKEPISALHVVNLTAEPINIYDVDGDILCLTPKKNIKGWLKKTNLKSETVLIVDQDGVAMAERAKRSTNDLVMASTPQLGRGGIHVRRLFGAVDGRGVKVLAAKRSMEAASKAAKYHPAPAYY